MLVQDRQRVPGACVQSLAHFNAGGSAPKVGLYEDATRGRECGADVLLLRVL